MASFLVTIALGPVQSLIGAARRTRDLWCGSWLLSEAARAAARALHEHQPGCLIFPCPQNPDEELRPQDSPHDAANIANVLRAEVKAADADEVRTLCDLAKSCAAARILDIGAEAKTVLGVELRDDVWAAQADDIIETFAAWVEIVSDDYAAASRKLGATLAARKATRDFGPSRLASNEGLPKSSLDGAMETVLPRWPKRHPARRKLRLSKGEQLPLEEEVIAARRARRKLRLSKGEQLDALGVIKRLGGDAEQFTAYSRIAADPWIRYRNEQQLERIRTAYEPLVGKELATRTKGNAGAYSAMPYDAQLLHPSRLESAWRGEREEAGDELRALRDCLARIDDQPVPYAAILKADGDRMGKLLSAARTAKQSRRMSQALHAFASTVNATVRCHHGHAIYAGGDDVLALVPLPDAEDCARKLACDFRARMCGLAEEMRLPEEDAPTLSAGIGIGHIMEPLGALRERADRAERAAKGDGEGDASRNALAIVLGVRGGGEITWRARWDDAPEFHAIRTFRSAYRQGRLPSRVAYDLRAIDRRLAWLDECDGEAGVQMRKAEVRRMLDRARVDGKKIEKCLADLLLSETARPAPKGRRRLAQVADTLILARWLAARTNAELGERE